MATDLEKKAKEAFVDDDFDLAVDLYTQAIDMDPKNADLYADRAQANIKINNFTGKKKWKKKKAAPFLIYFDLDARF